MAKNKNKNKPFRREKTTKDENLIAYKGPIVVKNSTNEVRTTKMNVSLYTAIGAAAGSFNQVFSDAGWTSVGDYASIAAVYAEWRVLGFKLEYIPEVIYGSTTNVHRGLITVVDHDINSTLGSYAAGANHESAKMFFSGEKWSRSAKTNGLEEAEWNIMSSSADHYWIKIYGTGFSATQTLGNVFITYLLELRGKV